MQTVRHQVANYVKKSRERRLEARLPTAARRECARLEELLARRRPRIIVVKQDVNEDLYCCPPEAKVSDLIASTLLRTGPVSLFSDLRADFRILTTTDDPECQIWMERATVLEWDTVEFFSSYRDRIPGREYGQKRWAAAPESIDWDNYDIVISIDVCVPARITLEHPNALWCYYVREIKAPAYAAGMRAPAAGQDVVLNHCFRLVPATLPSHVLEFPYHLQRAGCFHEVFGVPFPDDSQRTGVFVDHHTMVTLNSKQRSALAELGPVASTIHAGEREVVPTSEKLARRTMDEDLRERLLNSRFFLLTPGKRGVWGTALVEAIAAGCLAIGSPKNLGAHGFLFTEATSANSPEEAMEKMRRLNEDVTLFEREAQRQRLLIDYVCYYRPARGLVDAWRRKCVT